TPTSRTSGARSNPTPAVPATFRPSTASATSSWRNDAGALRPSALEIVAWPPAVVAGGRGMAAGWAARYPGVASPAASLPPPRGGVSGRRAHADHRPVRALAVGRCEPARHREGPTGLGHVGPGCS